MNTLRELALDAGPYIDTWKQQDQLAVVGWLFRAEPAHLTDWFVEVSEKEQGRLLDAIETNDATEIGKVILDYLVPRAISEAQDIVDDRIDEWEAQERRERREDAA